jgi:membrane-bound lytic murein transglycosylase B
LTARCGIAAIWGLETRYGAVRGTVDTICALATLAFEGRRAALFQDELLQALNILAGGHVARSAMIGSWAGAMGHMQFMPSSWRAFAVDADGDGRCDIWGPDPADALASAANYLRHWGWIPGQPWGLEVALPPGFDFRLAGRGRPKPAIGWQALGVRAVAGDLPDAGAAEIHLPALERDDAGDHLVRVDPAPAFELGVLGCDLHLVVAPRKRNRNHFCRCPRYLPPQTLPSSSGGRS